jgi:hypothetical protein
MRKPRTEEWMEIKESKKENEKNRRQARRDKRPLPAPRERQEPRED